MTLPEEVLAYVEARRCTRCHQRHRFSRFQASPVEQPETVKDVVVALVVWSLCIVAFVSVVYAAAGAAS